jgi:hypothetical protein
MTHADMTECIENVFMAENTIGHRQFLDDTLQAVRHWIDPRSIAGWLRIAGF